MAAERVKKNALIQNSIPFNIDFDRITEYYILFWILSRLRALVPRKVCFLLLWLVAVHGCECVAKAPNGTTNVCQFAIGVMASAIVYVRHAMRRIDRTEHGSIHYFVHWVSEYSDAVFLCAVDVDVKIKCTNADRTHTHTPMHTGSQSNLNCHRFVVIRFQLRMRNVTTSPTDNANIAPCFSGSRCIFAISNANCANRFEPKHESNCEHMLFWSNLFCFFFRAAITSERIYHFPCILNAFAVVDSVNARHIPSQQVRALWFRWIVVFGPNLEPTHIAELCDRQTLFGVFLAHRMRSAPCQHQSISLLISLIDPNSIQQ